MRPGLQFSSTDRKDLERRGITLREAEQQLALLESPPPPIPLRRACRPGDGIAILAPEQAIELERAWDLAVEDLRVVKFVPASGAATRMFSFLEKASGSLGDPSRRELARAAGRGDAAAGQVLELAERIEEMPFASALKRLAIERSTTLADLKEWPLRLAALVAGAEGLALASLPKGLVPFHSYDSRPRSAFEEHLYEATGYAQGRDQLLALHFTVNREHLVAFQGATERAEPTARRTAGARFEIEFSIQDPSTDTLALAANGVPYRSSAGHLVFRPAGHGALITNLGRIDADVIFIKNIDNIAPAWRHRQSAVWKKRLGGHLLRLRTAISELLDRLERGDAGAAEDALSFCQDHLTLGLSGQITTEPRATLRALLIERLDRPLRVCGVVQNVGEPGGGPFWVESPGFGESGQIVEASQIDLESADQAEILESASHFNPVDVACSLLDRKGKPYDLSRFADPRASLVASKQHRGETIRVLERPGLWNGAMAGWNTAFVEVPLATFTPVKTVLDLLRPEHRATGSPQT